jgi:MFS family permease
MILRPQTELSEAEVQTGLKRVIGDGLAAEAMTTFTGGAFLIAMALLMGASNFQIGLLAAMPTFTNIFQLLSIWLVRKYNNRRAISVICSILARVPLLIVGCLVLFFASGSLNLLIFFLFFYYFFGSIAGPSWNSWMKDLVPEKSLGAYFSRRSSYTQTLNVVLSLSLAFVVDYIKRNNPQYELSTYAIMFLFGGLVGLTGAWFLSRTPEPQSYLARENIFRLFKRPLQNYNFSSLLIFNSAWAFAINLATPFFTVFLLKSMHLPLSYIIGLGIISQLCSIFTIRIWGRYADNYSNKTIIAIGAPLYILCIIAWCFVGIYSHFYANIALLVGIYIVTGISTAGINLSLTNIGLKLAPREEAIVYLSVKNIITAFFSSIAPLLGGYLADYFLQRHLNLTVQWGGPQLNKVFRLIELHDWNFLFAIGAILAFIALEFLVPVQEVGEVEKNQVVKVMRSSIRNSLKDAFVIGQLIDWHQQLWGFIRKRTVRESKQSVADREQ